LVDDGLKIFIFFAFFIFVEKNYKNPYSLKAVKSTNQTMHSSSYKCAEDGCLVGLVDLRARHSAKIRAKN
jgi:hypothetical protein